MSALTPDSPRVSHLVSGLADRFAGRFPATRGQRQVGREAEFPVVYPSGEAFDVAALWGPMLEAGDLTAKREGDLIVALRGEGVEYALEVGYGTIEVITGPFPDLLAQRDAHEAAVSRVVDAARQVGARVLGYGIQPLTPATPALMSPKQRYKALLDVIGAPWLSFTATASDQLHVDIARAELVAMFNLGNLLAPVTVALCGNSSISGGSSSGYMSARDGHMGEIGLDEGRHGMPLRAVRGEADYVGQLARQGLYLTREGDQVVPQTGTFLDWLVGHPEAGSDDRFAAFLLHEHYIWNSARPRCAQGTVELRASCQQPFSEHMAAAALHLGMVEAAPELAMYLQDALGDDPWPAMREWHGEVVRRGLAAGEPSPGFLDSVLRRCAAGLRARGLGEEALLEPMFGRLERRSNPAQDAQRIFEREGIAALVDALAAP